jgi:hypothetical protein
MHDGSSATQSSGYDRCEFVGVIGDGPQAIHQPLKDSFLLIVVTVADAYSAGMAPDLGRQKQKTQSRRRQSFVFHLRCVGRLFPIEEHQPAV